MKHNVSLLMFLISFSISCVSTHPGKIAKPMNKDTKIALKMSAEELNNPGSKAFQLIEVTFENTSDQWLRINSAEIVISDELKNQVSVVVGEDLVSWSKAMEMKLKQEQHNDGVAKAILIGAGLAAAGRSTDDAVAGIGAVMLDSGYAWAATDAIRFSIDSVKQVDKVPSNHLYKSFSVPGLMSMRRWVLLNKPVGKNIDKLAISIETVEGENEVYEVKM